MYSDFTAFFVKSWDGKHNIILCVSEVLTKMADIGERTLHSQALFVRFILRNKRTLRVRQDPVYIFVTFLQCDSLLQTERCTLYIGLMIWIFIWCLCCKLLIRLFLHFKKMLFTLTTRIPHKTQWYWHEETRCFSLDNKKCLWYSKEVAYMQLYVPAVEKK